MNWKWNITCVNTGWNCRMPKILKLHSLNHVVISLETLQLDGIGMQVMSYSLISVHNCHNFRCHLLLKLIFLSQGYNFADSHCIPIHPVPASVPLPQAWITQPLDAPKTEHSSLDFHTQPEGRLVRWRGWRRLVTSLTSSRVYCLRPQKRNRRPSTLPCGRARSQPRRFLVFPANGCRVQVIHLSVSFSYLIQVSFRSGQ